jgi:uncharacterized membrane protein YobD (UPF0266 family)
MDYLSDSWAGTFIGLILCIWVNSIWFRWYPIEFRERGLVNGLWLIRWSRVAEMGWDERNGVLCIRTKQLGWWKDLRAPPKERAKLTELLVELSNSHGFELI